MTAARIMIRRLLRQQKMILLSEVERALLQYEINGAVHTDMIRWVLGAFMEATISSDNPTSPPPIIYRYRKLSEWSPSIPA